MNEKGFTEKDWKFFRNKVANWQESYIDKLNREYIELLNKDINPSEKFWQLEERIKQDKKKVGVQLEMSRSNLIYNIAALVNEDVISIDELEEFSDELKETIKVLVNK